MAPVTWHCLVSASWTRTGVEARGSMPGITDLSRELHWSTVRYSFPDAEIAQGQLEYIANCFAIRCRILVMIRIWSDLLMLSRLRGMVSKLYICYRISGFNSRCWKSVLLYLSCVYYWIDYSNHFRVSSRGNATGFCSIFILHNGAHSRWHSLVNLYSFLNISYSCEKKFCNH